MCGHISHRSRLFHCSNAGELRSYGHHRIDLLRDRIFTTTSFNWREWEQRLHTKAPRWLIERRRRSRQEDESRDDLLSVWTCLLFEGIEGKLLSSLEETVGLGECGRNFNWRIFSSAVMREEHRGEAFGSRLQEHHSWLPAQSHNDLLWSPGKESQAK